MRLAVIQFTCPQDEGCAKLGRESVERMARRHGLDIEYVAKCKEGGRGVHLNGIEAVTEMLSEFELLRGLGFDWVVKMDSDTLWTGGSFLDRLVGPWKLVGGQDFVPQKKGPSYPYIRGHGYCLKLDTFQNAPKGRNEITELLSLVDVQCGFNGSRPASPEMAWPEDEAVSGMVRYLYGEGAILGLPVRNSPVCQVGFWPFLKGVECSEEIAREMAGRFDFIEFGRMTEQQATVSRKARRELFTVPAMRSFLDATS